MRQLKLSLVLASRRRDRQSPEMLVPPRKRERPPEAEPDAERLAALAAVAEEEPSDEMDAALALSGMLSASPRAAGPGRARDLTTFPSTNQFFPHTAGKGWPAAHTW